MKVLDPVDMLRADTQFIHLLFIVRDVIVNSFDLSDQPFILPCCDLFPGGAFHLRVKIVLHFLSLSSFIYVLMRARCLIRFRFARAAYYLARFANLVSAGCQLSSTVPIGPLRCLAMMISAIPFFSESWL